VSIVMPSIADVIFLNAIRAKEHELQDQIFRQIIEPLRNREFGQSVEIDIEDIPMEPDPNFYDLDEEWAEPMYQGHGNMFEHTRARVNWLKEGF